VAAEGGDPIASSSGTRRLKPAASGWESWSKTLAIPAIILAVLIARRPASLLHADFWAEDGWHWYPDAYNDGWRALFRPYAGYLQSICRLVGLIVQPFPLLWAPTLFSIAALGVQVAAACLLLSSRMNAAWPHRPSRMLFAFIYLLLPNSFEIYANLTNAQWHLSLVAFLLLVAIPARTSWGRVADFLLIMLCGLSGPFCLFLFPVSIWQAWRKRDRESTWKLALVFTCCIVQATLSIDAGRGASPHLGAGPRRLAVIIALQIILGTEIGRHAMPGVIHTVLWSDNALPILISFAAAALTLMAVHSGSVLVRQFILYAALVLSAGLLRPATGSMVPAWMLFTTPDIGNRYYVIPMLAWIGVLLTLAGSRRLAVARMAYVLIAAVLVAIPGDLHFATRLATSPPTNFASQAHIFASAPHGLQMRFPLRPEGAPPMILTKR